MDKHFFTRTKTTIDLSNGERDYIKSNFGTLSFFIKRALNSSGFLETPEYKRASKVDIDKAIESLSKGKK